MTASLRLALLLVLLLPGTALAGPLHVTASTPPLAWLARAVAGERATVQSLLPEGRCETFRLADADLARAARSDLILFLDAAFEAPWRADLLRRRPDLRLADAAQGLAPLAGPDGAEIRSQGLFGIWLDPAQAKALARNAARALEALDPAGAGIFSRNLAALEERLDRLDRELRELFASAGERRLFVSGRPDWAWLAAAYGLEERAVAPFQGEPTAQERREIWRLARQRGVDRILDRPGCGSKAARALALSLDARIFPADPLAGDYADNLLRAARIIRSALR